MHTLKLIVMGPPGVGKGTMSKMLEARFGLAHVSTGDLFREEIAKGTDLGKRIKTFLNDGRLLPNELVINIIKSKIAEIKQGFILDGFPRTIEQAEALDAQNLNIDAIIRLEAPEDVIVDRISYRRLCPKCGAIYNLKFHPSKKYNMCDFCGSALFQRKDDNIKVIMRRLEVYERETLPLVGYYEQRHALLHIDASENEPQIIFKRLVECLRNLLGTLN